MDEIEEIVEKADAGLIQPDVALTQISEKITPVDAEKVKKEESDDETDVRKKIQSMKIPQKIKTAMFGNAVCRSLLILEPSKMISLMVLKNPQLQLTEVETFLKNPNMPSHIIRAIADKKDWMRNYTLKSMIVTNPKTPQDVSIKWIRYLNDGDIKKIAKSHNIPSSIVNIAKKMVSDSARH